MKIYSFKRSQKLPTTLAESWRFFSSPHNLALITPKNMGFDIQYISGNGDMYPGQIIRYKIEILPGIKVSWTTEITHVEQQHYFVDEQRFGPYAFWHHQHRFTEVGSGVEMIDEINYGLPMGFFGRIANAVFVERQLNAIFDFRTKAISQHFVADKINSGN